MTPGRLETARELLDRGLEHLRGGRTREAIAALQASARLESDNLAAARGLATGFLLSGDPAGARRTLEQYTREHPLCAKGWRLAAQLQWKLRDIDSAIALLNDGLRHLPNSALLQRQLELYQGATGRRPAPVARIERLLEFSPLVTSPIETSPLESSPLLSHPIANTSDQASAIAGTDPLDATAQNPALIDAVLGCGNADSDTPADRQMLLELQRRLERLMEDQPHHADRLVRLARVQERLGDDAAAMLSVQRALRESPRDVAAWRLRAALHVKAGEIDGAIEILQNLLQRGLAWPDLHCELGELEQRRGRTPAARAHLAEAIRLNPRYEQARQLLARCAAA